MERDRGGRDRGSRAAGISRAALARTKRSCSCSKIESQACDRAKLTANYKLAVGASQLGRAGHSMRSACTGLTSAARRAGNKHASKEVAASNRVAPARSKGLCAEI